jgi:hypothetical protein
VNCEKNTLTIAIVIQCSLSVSTKCNYDRRSYPSRCYILTFFIETNNLICFLYISYKLNKKNEETGISVHSPDNLF